jgi:class 3 adenylate cyclase
MADFEHQQISATQRKLTTIFSADVQDYSRLMGTDEERTLNTLKQYRDAMGRLIMSHGGRVVNTWGDGLLAEFPSVVEALRAAIDVQNELAARNADRPTATRMVFRIGINLGDVIVEGDDIYGDGVNVAARLQTQAEPGGIVISNTVYDQVRNKVAVSFEFLGNLSVKNIAEDVPSYAVKVGESSSQAEPKVAPASAPQPAPASAESSPPAGSVAGHGRCSFSRLAVLAIIGAGLVVVNLLTGADVFWAKWPLLALALIGALRWVKDGRLGDCGIAKLVVIGLFIVGVNLLSWDGEFWAVWPLLGLAIAAGIRWVKRRGNTSAG